jgi:hypothetical protein
MSYYEFDFEGRKPSLAQVMKRVNEGIRQGASLIQVSWGENMITIQRYGHSHNWDGSGWIRGISGYDIARDLNQAQAKQFVRDHFEFVHIA